MFIIFCESNNYSHISSVNPFQFEGAVISEIYTPMADKNLQMKNDRNTGNA